MSFQRSLKGDLNSGISRKNIEEESLDAFSWYMLNEWRENKYVKFYTINVNPHDHRQPAGIIQAALYDIIRKCKTVISLAYIIEVSPEGKNHAHGILASKDYSKFLKVKKHPICQFYLEKYIPGNWISYIQKDRPPIIHFLRKEMQYNVHEQKCYWIKHEQLSLSHTDL